MAKLAIIIYINGTQFINEVEPAASYTVSSTGIDVRVTGGTQTWTYSGSGTFLGFSTTQGATTPDSNYEIGDTGTLSMGTYYLYSVEESVTPTGINNIWIGNSKATFYAGNIEVSKMYAGNVLIYEKASSGYSVTIYNNTGLDNVNIYDGQDNTGTYLGIVLMNDTETFTVTSGYIYAEWDDPYITDDITFAEDGSEIGNPIQVTSNMNLEVWDVPSGYEVTFNLFVGVSDMSGQTLKVKKDSVPTSENDYDYIVVTARGQTPTTNTLPSGSVSVNSLYMWCTDNSTYMKAGGYGWNSGSFSDTKAISGTTYSNAMQIDFTETINGYTFNGDIYIRMKFRDM